MANVACAGDVNGDGYADVIVGSLRYDNGHDDEGRALLWYGGSSGLGALGTPGNADWNVEGDQSNAHLGTVATAGDVNGDGLSDVIVGAVDYDNGQSNEGKAFVYLGSAGSLTQAISWTVHGEPNGYFGFPLASVGDVNGDGFSDVAVADHTVSNGQTAEGRVYVYYGSPTSPPTTPSWTAEGEQAYLYFGFSFGTAGDVNGDGFSDLIVGGVGNDHSPAVPGTVFVYYGSATGLATTPSWSTQGDPLYGFGVSVGTAGDVDGDGYADVVIGSIYYSNGQFTEGRAYLYRGSANGLESTPAWTAESDQAMAYFGRCVGTAGDVDADGFSDVIIGAPLYSNGQSSEGKTYLYRGSPSGLSSGAAWTAEGNDPGAGFGFLARSAGDVNGDGFTDVIVGASGYGPGGAAFVYHGSGSGLGATAAWSVVGDDPDVYLGSTLDGAGDINGDGFADVVVGAPSNVQASTALAYHGSAQGLSTTPNWTGTDPASNDYGADVAAAGDVNGDGHADVLIGDYTIESAYLHYGNEGPARMTQPRQARADGTGLIPLLGWSDSSTEFRIRATMPSPYGRAPLDTEFEVKPRGVLFDGSNTTSTGFLDTGSDGQSEIDRLISGLLPGTQYHWRVRARYDMTRTLFQRHGPWLHSSLNGWNEADLSTAPSGPAGLSEATPQDLSAIELLPSGPNPATRGSEVLLALKRRCRIDAEVVDAQGRSIANLAHGLSYEAGTHRLSWDGRDRLGSAAPAGVYFVVVRANGETRARKTVLID